ncbi:MAG: hypothetical protein DRI77_14760, partial [Chloroflexi bacterium]
MAIVQLTSFDITTAAPFRLLTTAGFWASLPQLSRGVPSARLLMVTDTLQPQDISDGFVQTAVPETELPPGVRAYRIQYEDFLGQMARAVRFLRLYLVADTTMGEEGLIRLLGTHGVAARPLDGPVPRPFVSGAAGWSAIETADGNQWALLRSKSAQAGTIFPRILHRLFSLDFPVWAALHVHTFPQREAIKLLRHKAVSARYAERKTSEAAQEANEIEGAVADLRHEMNRVGASLHTVRIFVLVGSGQEPLHDRIEMVRSSVSLEFEQVTPPGDMVRRIFSAETLVDSDGAPLTSPGVALLAGSALSFRRRTETHGVLLGIDRNQSPVIFNIFDDRNPSYNAVILGQTGAGKTFATLLMMLRHLLLGTRLIIVDPQGNIDLSFLGPDIYHKSVLGTGAAAINILDMVHDEIGNQVESVCSMLNMLGVLEERDNTARALLDDVLMDIYEPLWGRARSDEVP